MEYKYFIHGSNGMDDDIICLHPLVRRVQLVKNLVGEKEKLYMLPTYQVNLFLFGENGNEKQRTFGGQFVSSALEFADKFLKTQNPFDKFIISSENGSVEVGESRSSVTITAVCGNKAMSVNIPYYTFMSYFVNAIGRLPATEPFGNDKTLLEILLDKLNK